MKRQTQQLRKHKDTQLPSIPARFTILGRIVDLYYQLKEGDTANLAAPGVKTKVTLIVQEARSMKVREKQRVTNKLGGLLGITMEKAEEWMKDQENWRIDRFKAWSILSNIAEAAVDIVTDELLEDSEGPLNRKQKEV